MGNENKKYLSDADLLKILQHGNGFKDYIKVMRVHYLKILYVTLAAVILSVLYAYRSPDIYKSNTVLKVSKPAGNILEAPLISQFSDNKSYFILNEIEILKSYNIKEKVAMALLDSMKKYPKERFYLAIDQDKKTVLPLYKLTDMMDTKVTIEQRKDLEIIDISAQSPSAFEAAMVANIYAEVYHNMNLNISRTQMTTIRDFLEKQSSDKKQRLLDAEENLKAYQEKGGVMALDDQPRALISQLTDFEAKKNAAKVEMIMVQKAITDYKNELQRKEPQITDYMEKYAVEPYIEELQREIVKYQLKKDLITSSAADESTLKDYDAKIASLKEKRDKKLEVFKAGMLASSSEEVKTLAAKVLEQEVRYHSLAASYNELSSIVKDYEKKFNELPERTIQLARLMREKGESEKLYVLLQEKFQEAMVNEQSTPGNVLIIDKARVEHIPFKPNRKLIVLIGFVLGLGLGMSFVLIYNYFDRTIKTPEDIEKMNINILGWVPNFETGQDDSNGIIVANKLNSTPGEAYRAIRTRIQFSKVVRNSLKTILVTSGSPQEGKTLTSVNLAASFAMNKKKTLIIDCDLRKPRVHKIFNTEKSPGFTDYLLEQATFDDIVRCSNIENLYFISSGVIPPNPAEILSSQEMIDHLERLKENFDIIVIDSPPLIAVTDAEILSRIADATILVAAADTTEIDLFEKSVNMLKHDDGSFIGVVLNNFIYRNGYGSYYKNYYYYQPTSTKA